VGGGARGEVLEDPQKGAEEVPRQNRGLQRRRSHLRHPTRNSTQRDTSEHGASARAQWYAGSVPESRGEVLEDPQEGAEEVPGENWGLQRGSLSPEYTSTRAPGHSGTAPGTAHAETPMSTRHQHQGTRASTRAHRYQ